MKQVSGFWCPDYDDDLKDNIRTVQQFAGRTTYQFDAFRRSFGAIGNFRHALDIGAHVGLWTAMLAPCFGKVTAFEPVPEHAECFRANHGALLGCQVVLHEVALGEKTGKVFMVLRPPVSLKAHIRTTENAPTSAVPMRTLDSFAIDGPIDFIKIDCEGYELFVLQGGEATIRRNKPAMLIEQKVGSKRYGLGKLDAVALCEAWGAKRRSDASDDFLVSW